MKIQKEIGLATGTPHILSLGAGVQSSTLALMAALGHVTPMPVCAIFADTQDEPASVYTWLDWLEKQLPFPVHRVTKGKLSEGCLIVKRAKVSQKLYCKHGIPAFIRTPANTVGLSMRQCTLDFKILPIIRQVRSLKKANGWSNIVQWIGISSDEARRMKQSRDKWITNRWPLIEMEMSRNSCVQWLKRNNFPIPPRSACVYCPYHNDREWLRMKREDPDSFARSVEFELQYQAAHHGVLTGTPFLHRSCVPLDKVDFDPDKNQGNLFTEDCTGMCGN